MSRCRFDEIDYGDEMQVVENYVYKVDKIYFFRNSRQVGDLLGINCPDFITTNKIPLGKGLIFD